MGNGIWDKGYRGIGGSGDYNKRKQQLSLCWGESVSQPVGPTVLCTFAAKSRTL